METLSIYELYKIYFISDQEFAGESIFLAKEELIKRGVFK